MGFKTLLFADAMAFSLSVFSSLIKTPKIMSFRIQLITFRLAITENLEDRFFNENIRNYTTILIENIHIIFWTILMYTYILNFIS